MLLFVMTQIKRCYKVNTCKNIVIKITFHKYKITSEQKNKFIDFKFEITIP